MVDVSAKIEQARAHFEAGRPEQARSFLERALRQTPNHPDLANAMSLVLLALRQYAQSVFYAERAIQGRPRDAGYWQNLGNALSNAQRPQEAEHAYAKALEFDPRAIGARLGLSHELRLRNHFTEAVDQLRQGLAVAPTEPELLASLSLLLLKLARVEEAVAAAEEGLKHRPDDVSCAGALSHCLNYMPGAAPARVLAAQRLTGRAFAARRPMRWTTYSNTPDPERRIKVGILSDDLCRHAITCFIEPFFEHHDRKSIELIAYSTGIRKDAVTERLKTHASVWRDLSALPFEQRAEAIWKDRADILIDLAGNVAGNNLPALVMKPAAIQVNYLGYPSTTGFEEIDYRIVDSLTDPAGHDAYSSEKLIRIDPSFLCYRPPAPRPAPPRPEGPIVFGSFNSAPKINRPVIRLWVRLLNQVPGSRLLLKAFEFFDQPLTADLLSRFQAEGLDPSRIEIRTQTQTPEEHLDTYSQIDIALDPFPYNGTTTTFEALAMGVPVVTLRGDRHVARVSAAILANLGLPELIAADEDEYLRIAAALAADRPRRGSLRATLRNRLETSVLCDGPAFAARFDGAIRTMWRDWCSSRR